MAFHVDFPTGENALTSRHEHLVHLARTVLFVYDCIGVLVYTSVRSYTPGAPGVLILPALAEAASEVLFPFLCTFTQHRLRTKYFKSATAPPDLSLSCFGLMCSSEGKKGALDPQSMLVCRVFPQDYLSSSGIWPLIMIHLSSSHTTIPSPCVYLP